MKNIFRRPLMLSFLCLSCCGMNAQRALEYKVSRETRPNRIRCVGVELDAHFHANHVPRSEGAKIEDWANVIVPRIRDMQVQSLRGDVGNGICYRTRWHSRRRRDISCPCVDA